MLYHLKRSAHKQMLLHEGGQTVIPWSRKGMLGKELTNKGDV